MNKKNKQHTRDATASDDNGEEKYEENEKKIDSLVTVSSDISIHTEIKELIEKNIKWSQVIYNQNKKIKHRMTMLVVGNYLRLLLIIVPIILGIIYLPALFGDMWQQYGSTLGLDGTRAIDVGSLIKAVEQSGINVDPAQVQDVLQHLQK